MLGPSLDAALVAGHDPSSHPALRARAQHLVGRAHRRTLAAGLRRLVRDAERPPSIGTAVPVDRRAVREARRDLLALAEHLARDDVPIDHAGAVARVEQLLASPQSPLYVGGAVVSEARSALVELDRA